MRGRGAGGCGDGGGGNFRNYDDISKTVSATAKAAGVVRISEFRISRKWQALRPMVIIQL